MELAPPILEPKKKVGDALSLRPIPPIKMLTEILRSHPK